MELTSQQIIDGVPLGVLITDFAGTITAVNRALTALLGYSSAEIVGRSLRDLTPEADAEADHKALSVLAAGETVQPYVRELRTAAGEVLPFEISVGSISGPDSKPARALFAVKPLSKEMELLERLQRRSMHLIASSEVAKAATQILDIQELLTRCVDLIRTHFGFYYAAIFLIDEAGEWAVLRAATGEAGKRLLEKGHRLGVGSQSMVGWVTANNAARIALDVGEEAIRFDNPELPKTHSEMALPLRVRGEVIGALDVQSTSLNAFTPEDIQTIQMMADQVAIAIDNARLFSLRG
ncbi:MAG: hypothetical protein Kow00124_32260 [Anaerolineae bacterium]